MGQKYQDPFLNDPNLIPLDEPQSDSFFNDPNLIPFDPEEWFNPPESGFGKAWRTAQKIDRPLIDYLPESIKDYVNPSEWARSISKYIKPDQSDYGTERERAHIRIPYNRFTGVVDAPWNEALGGLVDVGGDFLTNMTRPSNLAPMAALGLGRIAGTGSLTGEGVLTGSLRGGMKGIRSGGYRVFPKIPVMEPNPVLGNKLITAGKVLTVPQAAHGFLQMTDPNATPSERMGGAVEDLFALGQLGTSKFKTPPTQADKVAAWKNIIKNAPEGIEPLDAANLPDRIVMRDATDAKNAFYRRLGYVPEIGKRHEGFPVWIHKDALEKIPEGQRPQVEVDPANVKQMWGDKWVTVNDDGTYTIPKSAITPAALHILTAAEPHGTGLHQLGETADGIIFAPSEHPLHPNNAGREVLPAPTKQHKFEPAAFGENELAQAIRIVEDYDPTIDVTSMEPAQVIDMAEAIASGSPMLAPSNLGRREPFPQSTGVPSFLGQGGGTALPDLPAGQGGPDLPLSDQMPSSLQPMSEANRLENISSQPPVQPGEFDLPLNQPASPQNMTLDQLNAMLDTPQRGAALNELKRRYPNTTFPGDEETLFGGEQGAIDPENELTVRIVKWAIERFRKLMGRDPLEPELQAQIRHIKEAYEGQGQLFPMEVPDTGQPIDADLGRIQAAQEADLLARTPMREPQQQSFTGDLGDTIIADWMRSQGIDPSGGGGNILGKFLSDESGTLDPNKLAQGLREFREWFRKTFQKEPSDAAEEAYLRTAFNIREPEQELLPHPGGYGTPESPNSVGRLIGGERYIGQSEYPLHLSARERPFQTLGGDMEYPSPTEMGQRRLKVEADWRDAVRADPDKLESIFLGQAEQQPLSFGPPPEPAAIARDNRLNQLRSSLARYQNMIDSKMKLTESQQRIYDMLKKFLTNEQGATEIPQFKRKSRGTVDTQGGGQEEIRPLRAIVEATRNLTTTWDLSAPMKQGLPLIGTKEWFDAWGPMVRTFFARNANSEKAYNETMAEILARPDFKRGPINLRTKRRAPSFAEHAGLKLTDLGDNLSNREEGMASKWVEKLIGAKQSNRAYNVFLNKLRADTFESLLTEADNLGLNPREDLELARAIGDFVMTATGRGPLETRVPSLEWAAPGSKIPVRLGTRSESLEQSAKRLTGLFFAPRLQASRIRMLNPLTYANAPPFVRRQYTKAALRTLTASLMMSGMAAMGGADVSLDPTSPDFLKGKIGNTRLDFGGGFQQYVVMAMRLLAGRTTSSGTSGGQFELGQGYRAPTAFDVIQNFAANKLNPVAGFTYDFLSSTNYQPMYMLDSTAQAIVPMIAQDLWELWNENPSAIPIALPANFFGIGSQTYERGVEETRFFPKEWDYEYKGNTLAPIWEKLGFIPR